MLTSSEVRPILQQLIALELPDVAVLAYQELDPNLSITARETLRPVADKTDPMTNCSFRASSAMVRHRSTSSTGSTRPSRCSAVYLEEQRPTRRRRASGVMSNGMARS